MNTHPQKTNKSPLAKALIFLAYLGFFWFVLPGSLLWVGNQVDLALGVQWKINLWARGLAGILWLLGGTILFWSIAQLWRDGKGLPISHLPPTVFVAQGLYRYFRHPIYVGFTLAFAALSITLASWGSMVLSTPLLLFAWIVYALFLEEPVLIERFGESYRTYQREVGLFGPKAPRLALWTFFSTQKKLTKTCRFRYARYFVLLYVLWLAAYTAIGAYTQQGTTYTLFLQIDHDLPFVPAFEFAYMLCYILPMLPLFVTETEQQLHRLVFCWFFLNLFAFSMYLIFPVYRPRPTFEVTSLSTWLVSLEYQTDRPVNNFPSLHAGISMLVFLSCRGLRPWLAPFLAISAFGIGLGALLIKQHYLLDILVGEVLALTLWRISKDFFSSHR